MKVIAALALTLVAVTPAQATGGLLCRTAGARPVEVMLVIGMNAVPAVIQATLIDNGTEIPATLARSWLDVSELRLDFADPNLERVELSLRARKKGENYDGSLLRNGQRRWVRCSES